MRVPPLGLLWLALAAAYFVASALGERAASLAVMGLMAGALVALGGHRHLGVTLGLVLAAALWGAAGSLPYLACLPPLAAFAFMAWFFGRTLKAGNVPFIVRVARMEHPELPLDMERHAAWLTSAWAVLFVGLFATALGLSFVLPLKDWSRWVHALGYAVPAAFFVGELAYRKRRFRSRAHGSLAVLVGNVIAAIRASALEPASRAAPQAGRT